MPKFFSVFFFVLFSFSAFAQTSLLDYGQANVSGTSIIEAPMAPVVFLDQAPNGVNGLFADSDCQLCPTLQQSIAENVSVTTAGPTVGITELVIWGGYYPENIPNTTDNFTMILHADAGGTPGAVLFTQSGLQATSRVSTGVILFGCNEYMFTFDFSATPIIVPNTGTYWLEIFNNSVESGNFFWETGTLDATHGILGSAWYTTTPATSWNLDGATDLSIQINGDDNISGGTTFTDNFDSYIAGQQLACQNPVEWTTWSNLPCDPTEDAYISTNYAYSGANSCVIVLNNDLVRLHGSKTTGKWFSSFLFYIPTGKAGYFNQLSGFTPNPFQWAMECYFDVGGGGRLVADVTTNFTWTENTWHQVLLIVDLDSPTHQAELWLGTTDPLIQIATWDWTRGGTITNRIDASDFFGATANDEMYMDNYYFGDAMPPIIPVELVSFAATASEGLVELSWITATEINNQGFEVQRSSSGEFETIAFVEGHGTTTETQAYSYTDRSVNVGSYSYRLKQVDFDGTFEYSDVVEVDVPAPAVFALDQNYPNPFNPSTAINFRLAVDSKVSMKVFNVLGQEVASLLNSNFVAGSHQVNFDASSLNSGVYMYRIEATGIDGTNFVDVKKMILTK